MTQKSRENSCPSLHTTGGSMCLRILLCLWEVKYGSHKYNSVMAITHWGQVEKILLPEQAGECGHDILKTASGGI